MFKMCVLQEINKVHFFFFFPGILLMQSNLNIVLKQKRPRTLELLTIISDKQIRDLKSVRVLYLAPL